MGTRNLTILKSEGRVLAHYGQWDGHPDRLGLEVLKFIATELDVSKMREQVARTLELSDDQIGNRMKSVIGYDAVSKGYFSLEESKIFQALNPHLDRDFGGKILGYLQSAEYPEINNQIDFAGDSLFCEWAYMLDLDEKKLVVFRGFNKEPLTPSAAFFSYMKPIAGRAETYHPIKEALSIPFEVCKTMTQTEFLSLAEVE